MKKIHGWIIRALMIVFAIPPMVGLLEAVHYALVGDTVFGPYEIGQWIVMMFLVPVAMIFRVFEMMLDEAEERNAR